MKIKKVTLDLNLDVEGLTLEGNLSGVDTFRIWIMEAVFAYSAVVKGLNRAEQRIFYRVRHKVEDSNKVKDELMTFEEEEFVFIDRCFEIGRFKPEANELLDRIDKKMDKAKTKYLPELTKPKA